MASSSPYDVFINSHFKNLKDLKIHVNDELSLVLYIYKLITFIFFLSIFIYIEKLSSLSPSAHDTVLDLENLEPETVQEGGQRQSLEPKWVHIGLCENFHALFILLLSLWPL